MNVNLSDFPMLPGANVEGREPRAVSQDKLNQPLSGNAYAPREGDVFVFDAYDESGRVLAVEQNIPDSQYTSVSIACHRNGKPSWINQGQLTRINASGKATCEVTEKFRACGTVGDLLDTLKGKTLKVERMEVQEFVPYGSNTKTSRPTAIFSFS